MNGFSRFVLKLLLISTLVSCNANASDIKPGGQNLTGTLEFGGISRTYQLHLPPLQTRKSLPLMVALHGGQGNGIGMSKLTSLGTLADREGFAVVYPDGVAKQWADGRGTTEPEKMGVNDVAFLSSLVAELSQKYRIDAARVYATGISNGGFMTARLACEASNVFAAVAVVAATMPQSVYSSCKPARVVPFLLMHGSADTFVSEAGGIMTKGDGGLIASTTQTVQLIRGLNGCSSTPATSIINPVNDGTSVKLERYSGCLAGSEVLFYNIENGGHTWAGGLQYLPAIIIGKTSQDINASSTIWSFFADHPKP